MRSLAGGLALAVIALSGTGISAEAAPQFVLPPQPLATGTPPSNSPYTELADVAMDAQGDTSLLFGRVDTTTGNWRLMSTYRPAGGGFSAPEEISATEIGQTDLENARIAMNASGYSAATWNESSGAIDRPVASIRPPGGDWETRQPLTLDPGFDAIPAVDAAGDVQVIFIGLINNNEYAVESTGRLAGSPSWSGAVPISATPIAGGDSIDEHSLDLAVNGNGDAVAGWVRSPNPNGGALAPEAEAAARDAGGAWGPARTLEVNPQNHVVPVSIDAAGEGLAAPSTSDGRLSIDLRPPHGSFSGAPTPISGTNAGTPQLTEDAAGNALATWQRDPGTGPEIERATRPAGGAFATPAPLGPDAAIDSSALAGDSVGNAVLTWAKSTSTSGLELDAVGRAAGGPFGPLTPLFTTAATNDYLSRERAASGGSGDGIVAWQDINTTTHNDGVYLVPYDGAGPQLRSLVVPSSGTAGQPVSFSVNPVDTWSSVAATSWNFGDGATADGTSPSHTYAAAGTYTVQVTSTDSLGNASSASRTVAVGAAPAAQTLPPISLDATPPTLSAVSMSHRSFAVAKRATAISARRKKRVVRGSAFRYTLSEPATVTFVIQQAHRGQKVGKRCVKPKHTKARRKAKRCTYYTRAGALKRARPAGRSVTPFSGRIGKRALKPGSYRVVITAVDAARNHSASKRLTFKIVRG